MNGRLLRQLLEKNENLNVRKTKQNRLMLLSNCAICSKKSTFIKNQELQNLIIFQMISLN